MKSVQFIMTSHQQLESNKKSLKSLGLINDYGLACKKSFFQLVIFHSDLHPKKFYEVT